MKASFQFICLGTAAMALSGCALPNYPQVKEVEQPVSQVAKKPAYTAPATNAIAPVSTQNAVAEVEVEDEVKPKNRWAHQPIGNTGNASDGGGGGDLGGGDEDGGWG